MEKENKRIILFTNEELKNIVKILDLIDEKELKKFEISDIVNIVNMKKRLNKLYEKEVE